MPRTYKRKTERPYKSGKPQALPTAYAPGFLKQLDQRTELCRALRERFDSVAVDLGGAGELSGIKSSLLERFVFLEATLVRLEADMAEADDAKVASEIMARWIQACNALLGFAKTLGIERRAKRVDLRTYIADGAGGVSEGK